MRKMEIGQILYKNELDMDKFMIWFDAYGTIKFYADGSPNYMRADVERYLKQKRLEDAVME